MDNCVICGRFILHLTLNLIYKDTIASSGKDLA